MQVIIKAALARIEVVTMSVSTQKPDFTHTVQGTALDPDVMAYMEEQAQLFDQQRNELLQRYSGQFVWFENGQVLDADPSEAALVTRIYSGIGVRPIFIEQVAVTTPQPNVRTPFQINSI
jgi:hypothetical protein